MNEHKDKKRDVLKLVSFLMIVCVLLGIFAACDVGSEVSEPEISSQTEKQTIQWKDPPEIDTIKPLDPIPLPDQDADDHDEPERVVRYAASSESNKYHRLSCHYVDRIKSYNIVYYYTEEEAQRAGKKPCSVCSP